jgi:uroporphyrinogen decarboxylase
VTIKKKRKSYRIREIGEEFIDDWGIPRKVVRGYYSEQTGYPLSNVRNKKELDEHLWPDINDYTSEGIRAEAERLDNEGYAVIGDQPIGGGVFDVAFWLRGFETCMMDLYDNSKIINSILDKIHRSQIELYDMLIRSIGDIISIIAIGEDFGSQHGLLISPELFRRHIKPRNKELFDFIHKKTSAKIFVHSCGSIEPIIGDLIEIGVDIINPIQTSARGMNPEILKKKWGSNITFCGAIDTQKILPLGSTLDVENEVKNKIKIFAPGGGYILASVHNIQGDVRPENIISLFRTAQEFGRYPIEST